MREFEFQSTFRNVEVQVANRALQQFRKGKAPFWEGWLGYIGGGLVVGLIVGLFSSQLDQRLGLAVSVIVIGFSGVLVYLACVRRAREAVVNAPIRSGVTQIGLSSNGVSLNHPGHDSVTRWSHILDVVTTPQGLILLFSEYEYYPIEIAAFQDADELSLIHI